MFKAINYTFGTDLLITILILVISISIGIYLALTFLVFVGDHGEHLLFILAYLLYATVPSLRSVLLLLRLPTTVFTDNDQTFSTTGYMSLWKDLRPSGTRSRI